MQRQGIRQRIKILRLLSKRGFISGEEIATRCGISRISAWKHINHLISYGVKIKIHPNKGYELISFGNRLLPEIIWLKLGSSQVIKEIIYLDEIDSTNEYAKRLLKPSSLIIAEQQKKGKGRSGRRWYSQKYKDLLFSITVSPDLPYTYIGIFSVVGVLSVVRAINKLYRLKARGKWPNDVVVDSKKISGVLIEFFAHMDLIDTLILGIGINVNSFPRLRNTASVRKLLNREVERAQLLTEVIKLFEEYYYLLEKRQLGKIKKDWMRYSVDYSRQVTFVSAGSKIKGISQGIDEYGNLVMNAGKKILIIPPVTDARLLLR